MDKGWQPYTKDCSLGYCSYYCPQFCFFLFPTPPPPSPSHLLSPLLIAIIAVFSTFLLLLSYYLLLTRYRRRHHRSPHDHLPPPNNNPSGPHACHNGLDDNLINKLSVHQYRPGSSLLIEGGADCSVCLSPFEFGDTIRLLPECQHPFHVSCIDTWLKSHSTCPLCRSGIFPVDEDHDQQTVLVIQPEHQNSSESESEIIEIEVERGSMSMSMSMSLGRSLSMDIERDSTVALGWSRALQSDMSPLRMMKRSASASAREGLPT